MFDYMTLKLIWWLLVGVLLIGFAIMDGHDMGVGTLLPFLGKDDTDRRVMINSVAPHWDGNQVWFIAFAPADNPQVAIAVTVEGQPAGATGGVVAAPIAARVLDELLKR